MEDEFKSLNYNDAYEYLVDAILNKNVDNEQLLKIVDYMLFKFNMGVLEKSMMESFKLSLKNNITPYYEHMFNIALNFTMSQTYYSKFDDPVLLFKSYLASRRF